MDPIYEIELEDCPFCGGAGLLEEEQGWCWYAMCVDCGSQTAAFSYKTPEERQPRFYVFLFLTETRVLGTALAADFVTLYLFFEMTTLLSFPLVLHAQSDRAVLGASKYLYYSVAGAFLALVGGGLRLTQLLGRTAWEGGLQGHGEGGGFLLGLVLLGGTAELGQLL